jgi:hypothetical protein
LRTTSPRLRVSARPIYLREMTRGIVVARVVPVVLRRLVRPPVEITREIRSASADGCDVLPVRTTGVAVDAGAGVGLRVRREGVVPRNGRGAWGVSGAHGTGHSGQDIVNDAGSTHRIARGGCCAETAAC